MPKKKEETSEIITENSTLEIPAPESSKTAETSEPVEDKQAEQELLEEVKAKVSRKTPAKKEKKELKTTEEPVMQPEQKLSEENKKSDDSAILTIESGSQIMTPEEQEEIAWHEVRNAYRTKKILTGKLSGIEPTENKKPIAVISYNGYRVVIPISEMGLSLSADETYGDIQTRQLKILGNMIGAEVDFVIKGIESKSRSIVASRKEAMLRKRKLFFEINKDGLSRTKEGQLVQARVIAVAEKAIRIECFGVECAILARDLSYSWLGDAHDYYQVGDEILIRIQSIHRDSIETLSIQADVKSVSGDHRENLNKCKVQGRYAGTITDIHKGVVFVHLNIGVNAVAHSCYDSKMPCKKDEVSFVVTHLDTERNVAVGIITRIMRRSAL